eukprot:2379529-Pyramimonas_sp.AAC.1
MREAKVAWKKKRYGVQLGHTQEWQMTNVRFADDVLSTSSTCRWPSATSDKTKIFTSTTKKIGRGQNRHAEVNGMHINILRSDEK